ncbi:serine protease 55-like [Paramacrobiotus metropolitanus]|uniref:serine protease 55-like n=1 Tax=Paramacrobiotus metropolitanus TaxID=2943436 RepID=UPI0024456289|nr:serine protease 55-like [Paramacrobiotus metropolitanus]
MCDSHVVGGISIMRCVSVKFSTSVVIAILLLIVLISEPGSCGNLVRLVSKCTTKAGIGRCTSLPSSCMDMGGIVEDELQLTNGERPRDYCPDDEVCCVLPPIPFTETCQICGKKGNDRTARKSNLERNLDENNGQQRHRLRALRDVWQAEQDAARGRLMQPDHTYYGQMGRIMNGDNARKSEWCWQVALLNIDGSVLGSGSLIDGRYIVTAAHKIAGRNISELIVLIGQYDFANPISPDDNGTTTWYAKPLEIIVHELFNPQTLDNNIALIRIPMVNCNTANVCPVCLNSITDSVDYLSTFTNCYITGWGATVSKRTSTILQEARVRILPTSECLQRFATLGLADLQLPASAFCAEGTGSNGLTTGPTNRVMSTCGGDGGGPLVCESGDGLWRLVGLIALGLDECKQGKVSAPTVFINVAMFVDWVHAVRRRMSKGADVEELWGGNSINVKNKPGDREPKSVDRRKADGEYKNAQSVFGRALF